MPDTAAEIASQYGKMFLSGAESLKKLQLLDESITQSRLETARLEQENRMRVLREALEQSAKRMEVAKQFFGAVPPGGFVNMTPEDRETLTKHFMSILNVSDKNAEPFWRSYVNAMIDEMGRVYQSQQSQRAAEESRNLWSIFESAARTSGIFGGRNPNAVRQVLGKVLGDYSEDISKATQSEELVRTLTALSGLPPPVVDALVQQGVIPASVGSAATALFNQGRAGSAKTPYDEPIAQAIIRLSELSAGAKLTSSERERVGSWFRRQFMSEEDIRQAVINYYKNQLKELEALRNQFPGGVQQPSLPAVSGNVGGASTAPTPTPNRQQGRAKTNQPKDPTEEWVQRLRSGNRRVNTVEEYYRLVLPTDVWYHGTDYESLQTLQSQILNHTGFLVDLHVLKTIVEEARARQQAQTKQQAQTEQQAQTKPEPTRWNPRE